MITKVSFPKLKTFSNSWFSWPILIGLLLFSVGCGDTGMVRPDDHSTDRRPAVKSTVKSTVTEQTTRQMAPRAPWQTWSAESYGSPEIALAERLAAEGRLQEALDAYGNAENSLTDSGQLREKLREELLLRISGTMLKLGRTQQALQLISKRFGDYGLVTDGVDPRLALVVAYAYEHQGDLDQTISWFTVAYRNDQKRTEAFSHATTAVRRVLSGIAEERFDNEESKWVSDGFVGPLFLRERQRRAVGGKPEQLLMAKWYAPETYRTAALGSVDDSLALGQTGDRADGGEFAADTFVPSGEHSVAQDGLIIGALLPLSGKFGEHGLRAKEGIELAVEKAQREGRVVQLLVGDTAGEPEVAAREYERLAVAGAHMVLGPLLVNTTVRVAKQSALTNLPFITFTKREKVLAGSKVGFRLGVTAEDQVRELLSYAAQEKKLSRFAVIYPENETGRELAAAFRKQSSQYQVQVVAESAYSTRVSSSVDSAVRMLDASGCEAIFVADALESSGALLQALKRGPLSSALLLGSATWDDAAALSSFGAMLEGAVFVSPFNLRSSDPETVAFIKHYRERHQREPGVLTAQAYDAAELTIKSFNFTEMLTGMADSRETRLKLTRNIRNVGDYQGVTGLLTVAGSGEISRRMSVVRYANGELSEVVARGLKTSFSADGADEKESRPVFR